MVEQLFPAQDKDKGNDRKGGNNCSPCPAALEIGGRTESGEWRSMRGEEARFPSFSASLQHGLDEEWCHAPLGSPALITPGSARTLCSRGAAKREAHTAHSATMHQEGALYMTLQARP
jgi:hypothetical protein